MSISPAVVAFAALIALMAAAVTTDVRSHRIGNRLVLMGMAAAFGLHAWALAAGALPLAGIAWWAPFAGMGVGLALLMPLHLLRACGAGDVKLMAMVGAFVGPAVVVSAALYTLAAGGVLALLFMPRRGVAARMVANVRPMLRAGLRYEPLQNTAARLPYALAISAGTLASLHWPLGGAA